MIKIGCTKLRLKKVGKTSDYIQYRLYFIQSHLILHKIGKNQIVENLSR